MLKGASLARRRPDDSQAEPGKFGLLKFGRPSSAHGCVLSPIKLFADIYQSHYRQIAAVDRGYRSLRFDARCARCSLPRNRKYRSVTKSDNTGLGRANDADMRMI